MRGNGLVDDAMQHLEQFAHIGCVAPLTEFFVDRLDVVVPLGVDQSRRLHQQRLETAEHHPGQNFITALGLIAGVHGIHRIGQQRDAGEPLGAQQLAGLKTQTMQMRFRHGQGIG